MKNKIPYKFEHLKTSLIAFIADFENKVHQYYPNIPVVMENIDDSFIFMQKYSKSDLEELYNNLPRIVLLIQSVQPQLDLNTSQFLKMTYKYGDKEYKTQFRRISTVFSIEIKLICSNYIKALEYWEFILTLLCIDNVLTYDCLGNTYQASYLLSDNPNIEKPQLNNATSESKNATVVSTIELNIQPTFINFNTIKSGSGGNYLINTDIIDTVGNGSGSPYVSDVDSSGAPIITNSKINTTQENNDLNISEEDEKRLLKNRKRVKKANILFDIHTKTVDNVTSEIYKSKIITDIYQNPTDE